MIMCVIIINWYVGEFHTDVPNIKHLPHSTGHSGPEWNRFVQKTKKKKNCPNWQKKNQFSYLHTPEHSNQPLE